MTLQELKEIIPLPIGLEAEDVLPINHTPKINPDEATDGRDWDTRRSNA